MKDTHESKDLSGYKFLVVEDDETNAILMKNLLELEGAAVDLTGTGEEALEYLSTRTYDMALIDINLGESKLDGVELLKKYHGTSPEKKVITVALTAYAMAGDKERFLNAGFDAYQSKPVFIESLMELIEEFLSGKSSRT